MKQLISKIESKIDSLPQQKRQWIWFVVLWCVGLGAVLSLSYMIKLGMGV